MRRGAWLALGWVLVVLGVAALVLPGPGLLLLAGGLAILSQHYEWACRRLGPVQRRARATAAASVRDRRHVAAAVLLSTALLALGVVWCVRPAAPSWWPLADGWWLPGGWATGSGLVLSGLVALGLLAWSWLRLRPGAGVTPRQSPTLTRPGG